MGTESIQVEKEIVTESEMEILCGRIEMGMQIESLGLHWSRLSPRTYSNLVKNIVMDRMTFIRRLR